MASYNMAIARCPWNVRAYYNRASVQQELTQFEKAIEDCNAVLSLNPTLYEIYSLRAWCYCAKGDYEQGRQDHAVAIHHERAHVDSIGAYFSLLIHFTGVDEIKQEINLVLNREKRKLEAIQQEIKQHLDELEDDIVKEERERRKADCIKTLKLTIRVAGDVNILTGDFQMAQIQLQELLNLGAQKGEFPFMDWMLGTLKIDSSKVAEPTKVKVIDMIDNCKTTNFSAYICSLRDIIRPTVGNRGTKKTENKRTFFIQYKM